MNSTAHKLLASSEDLASSGQCDPDQIRSVADQLEERMHDLMARSERRREQLEMSVAFQKTVNEVKLSLFGQLLLCVLNSNVFARVIHVYSRGNLIS